MVLNVISVLINRKETNLAYEILEKACKKDDVSADVLERFAYVNLLIGKTNESISTLKKVIEIDPAHVRACQSLSLIYLKRNEKSKTIKILSDLLDSRNTQLENRIDAADVAAGIMQIEPYVKPKLFPKLTNLLETLRIRIPINSDTLLYSIKLAEIYEKTGILPQAIEIYKKVYPIVSENTQMRIALKEKMMNLYNRNGDKTNAIQQIKSIIAEQPTNPSAYYYLGSLYYEIKDFEKAAEYIQRALILNPDFEPAYYDIASAYINANKPEDALKYLNRAREKFQKRRFALEFYSGIAYIRKKDYQSALKSLIEAEVIAKAYETNRLTAPFYFQLGATYERTGDYKQAEAYFNKCLKLEPDFSEALNYLGYMWADMNTNIVKAKILIEKALKLEPDNPAYLDSMGWVYYRQKKFNKALECIEKAAKLSKEPDATIYEHLGDIYYELKQWEKALEYWKKSLDVEQNPKVEEKLKEIRKKLKE